MKYLVVIEKGPTSFGASVPDLPGCVAVARTRPEVTRLIREAIHLHVQDMRDRGDPIPKPSAASEFVELECVWQMPPSYPRREFSSRRSASGRCHSGVSKAK